MTYFQTSLNLCQSDYNSRWIIGKSNAEATEFVSQFNGTFLLSGPRFCGKKHLISTLKECSVLFLNKLTDIEIISIYDTQINSIDTKTIFITDTPLNFSPDVVSRLSAMPQAIIHELTEDMFALLLEERLKKNGFYPKDGVVDYCLRHLCITYETVEACVRACKMNNAIGINIFKELRSCLSHYD
jgi:hypothetical protein